MGVCKFYMQGYCKFGSRCRYDHVDHGHGVHSSKSGDLTTNDRPIGGSILKGVNSSFSELNQSSTILFSQTLDTHHFSQKNASGPIGLFNVQEVMTMVTRDMAQAEKGGQWQLSCYGPARDLPNIPGLDDYSPEEIRWECYKALSNGTLPLWQALAQQLLTNVTKIYNELQSKDHLYALVDGWLRTIDSSHVPSQNMTPSFSGNAVPGVTFFNQNGPTEIYSTVSTDKQLFATKSSSPTPMLPFSSRVTNLSNDSQAYSQSEDLMEKDYEAFQADRFTIGKIPTKPPTVTFCNV